MELSTWEQVAWELRKYFLNFKQKQSPVFQYIAWQTILYHTDTIKK